MRMAWISPVSYPGKRRGRAGRFFFTGSKKSSHGAEGGYLLSGC